MELNLYLVEMCKIYQTSICTTAWWVASCTRLTISVKSASVSVVNVRTIQPQNKNDDKCYNNNIKGFVLTIKHKVTHF